ncbi:MAG: prepilin-type N-terminal cleavage/methylation domain-containing protein, partial [Pirellulales bacterium]|nr:prepilin-type N-terminal cleavage/methylation domain-containing protein [Pirellulales bacterium]
MHRHRIHSRNAYQRRGYTLIEMVISTTVGGVLVAGLASSLYIASQSLDVDSGSLGDKRVARRALARLHHDAQSAISVSELTNKRVTMTVPDRNGDSVPETIRYDWSGTAGDPLTLEYNGGTATTLADNVQSFSLAWVSRLLEGVAAQPIVLFVSGQSVGSNEVMATPSSSEQLRVNVLEGWGFSVTVISQHASPSEFDVALANSNVVYVSGEVSSLVLGTKLNAAISGVVTESFGHAGVLGFYGSFTASGVDSTQINIIDTNHYITSGLNTGNLQIVSSAERMKLTSSTIAPDATVLAKAGSPVAYPSLLVLNAGDELAGGATA